MMMLPTTTELRYPQALLQVVLQPRKAMRVLSQVQTTRTTTSPCHPDPLLPGLCRPCLKDLFQRWHLFLRRLPMVLYFHHLPLTPHCIPKHPLTYYHPRNSPQLRTLDIRHTCKLFPLTLNKRPYLLQGQNLPEIGNLLRQFVSCKTRYLMSLILPIKPIKLKNISFLHPRQQQFPVHKHRHIMGYLPNREV